MTNDRPDLARISSRLAANNSRVSDFIEGLPLRVDMLVAAAQDENWQEVRRVSGNVAEGGSETGLTTLAEAARRLCDDLDNGNHDLDIKRGIVKLIGQCGKARAPEDNSMSS